MRVKGLDRRRVKALVSRESITGHLSRRKLRLSGFSLAPASRLPGSHASRMSKRVIKPFSILKM
jgi:hypothetical protein